jgi:hypothetical protein
LCLQYTGVDAGYTPTDYVLRRYIYSSTNRCKWFSTTNSDNVYGSDIVHTIRNYENTLRSAEGLPEMLLAATDSRNFGELGTLQHDTFFLLLQLNFFPPLVDYTIRGTKNNWDSYCRGMMAMLAMSELTFTVLPRPQVGKVDLAGAFLSTDRFIAEKIFFSKFFPPLRIEYILSSIIIIFSSGNFTDTEKYPCTGCQDGYLIEYLMIKAFWRYERLPLQGLKSIVYHGPSPTWCVASGMVWLDHPKVNRVRCIPAPIVKRIRDEDTSTASVEYRVNPIVSVNAAITQKASTVFDWKFFDTQGKKVCLRFSEGTFAKHTELATVPLGAQDMTIFSSI